MQVEVTAANDKLELQVDELNDKSWLKNSHLNSTFESSYAFVPQIFTLYVCFNLAAKFEKVNTKRSLFKPAVRSKGKPLRFGCVV